MKSLKILAVVALTMAACASTKSAQIAPSSRWTPVWLADFDGEMPSERREAFLQFDDALSSYSSSVGCNTINGSLTASTNGTIAFGQGPMTKMACRDGGLERLFVQTLLAVDAYAIGGDTLVLQSGGKAKIKLVRAN